MNVFNIQQVSENQTVKSPLFGCPVFIHLLKINCQLQSIHRTVKDVLTESLLALLTPKRRIDILRDIVSSKKAGKPFVITFCGVNGVGKSTNLAKICFW